MPCQVFGLRELLFLYLVFEIPARGRIKGYGFDAIRLTLMGTPLNWVSLVS